MRSPFRKNYFVIDEPDIKLRSSKTACMKALKKENIPYREVADDGSYIVFFGRVLGMEEQICIGLHFAANRLQFIELFRPIEYIKEQGLEKSFKEFQTALVSRYGEPTVTQITDGDSEEGFFSKFYHYEWETDKYSIVHFVHERFGYEERLTVKIR